MRIHFQAHCGPAQWCPTRAGLMNSNHAGREPAWENERPCWGRGDCRSCIWMHCWVCSSRVEQGLLACWWTQERQPLGEPDGSDSIPLSQYMMSALGTLYHCIMITCDVSKWHHHQRSRRVCGEGNVSRMSYGNPVASERWGWQPPVSASGQAKMPVSTNSRVLLKSPALNWSLLFLLSVLCRSGKSEQSPATHSCYTNILRGVFLLLLCF